MADDLDVATQQDSTVWDAQVHSDKFPEGCWGRAYSMNNDYPSIDLSKPKYSFGRKGTNDVQIKHLAISGVHCELEFDGQAGECTVTDHSTNGTTVGSQKIGKGNKAKISSGSELILIVNREMKISYLIKINPTFLPPNNPEYYFDIGPRLGSGAFADVYRVTERGTGLPFAMKVMRKKKFLQSMPKTERGNTLRDECSILERLNHPNIIRIHKVFETIDDLYIVLEYMSGGDLFDHLHINPHGLSELQARELFQQMIAATEYLHGQNIVHRDLKPENILLSRRSSDNQLECKLSDFGLSRILGEGSFMKTVCGCLEENEEIITADGQTMQVKLLAEGDAAENAASWPQLMDEHGQPQLIERVYKGLASYLYEISYPGDAPYRVTPNHELVLQFQGLPNNAIESVEYRPGFVSVFYFTKDLEWQVIQVPYSQSGDNRRIQRRSTAATAASNAAAPLPSLAPAPFSTSFSPSPYTLATPAVSLASASLLLHHHQNRLFSLGIRSQSMEYHELFPIQVLPYSNTISIAQIQGPTDEYSLAVPFYVDSPIVSTESEQRYEAQQLSLAQARSVAHQLMEKHSAERFLSGERVKLMVRQFLQLSSSDRAMFRPVRLANRQSNKSSAALSAPSFTIEKIYPASGTTFNWVGIHVYSPLHSVVLSSGVVTGNTPQYLAPEVQQQDLAIAGYDKAVDLWSLGVILYVLLSGSLPFNPNQGNHFTLIRDGLIPFEGDWRRISESAKHLIRNLLKARPAERYNLKQVKNHPWMHGIAKIPEGFTNPPGEDAPNQFSVPQVPKKTLNKRKTPENGSSDTAGMSPITAHFQPQSQANGAGSSPSAEGKEDSLNKKMKKSSSRTRAQDNEETEVTTASADSATSSRASSTTRRNPSRSSSMKASASPKK